ncbi:hypothetical protein B0H13DRAFT_1900496 [Mycena leptocephala]|nr:hypothetical protein B0H13DRAFT_1900496 [Mycena leptocephala]
MYSPSSWDTKFMPGNCPLTAGTVPGESVVWLRARTLKKRIDMVLGRIFIDSSPSHEGWQSNKQVIVQDGSLQIPPNNVDAIRGYAITPEINRHGCPRGSAVLAGKGRNPEAGSELNGDLIALQSMVLCKSKRGVHAAECVDGTKDLPTTECACTAAMNWAVSVTALLSKSAELVALALRVAERVAGGLRQMPTRKLSRVRLKTDPGSSESVDGGDGWGETKQGSRHIQYFPEESEDHWNKSNVSRRVDENPAVNDPWTVEACGYGRVTNDPSRPNKREEWSGERRYDALPKWENKPRTGTSAMFYELQQAVHRGKGIQQHPGGVHTARACLLGQRVTYRCGPGQSRTQGTTGNAEWLPRM